MPKRLRTSAFPREFRISISHLASWEIGTKMLEALARGSIQQCRRARRARWQQCALLVSGQLSAKETTTAGRRLPGSELARFPEPPLDGFGKSICRRCSNDDG